MTVNHSNKSRPKTRVSMQSIADLVGVSRTTVSFVLNGKEKEGRISPVVAKKIKEVARRENYRFNELARSLRTGYTRTIALVVADISDRFFASLAFHVQQQALHKGYLVVIASVGEDKAQFLPTVEMLIDRRVDGMIVVPIQHTEQEIARLIETGFPIVLADRYFPDLKTNRVIIDNFGASFQIVSLLLEKGCRRIAMLLYDDQLMHMQERQKGYEKALGKYPDAAQPLICKIGYTNTQKETEETIRKLFSDNATPAIDGLFFATGGLAMFGIQTLTQMGIPLDGKIQIACFDRADFVPNLRIPYVHQPIREMSEAAVNMLLTRIEGNDHPDECKVLEPRIIQQ